MKSQGYKPHTDGDGGNMDNGHDVDLDADLDLYDDPSLDSFYNNICRSDAKEYKQKLVSKRTRQLCR